MSSKIEIRQRGAPQRTGIGSVPQLNQSLKTEEPLVQSASLAENRSIRWLGMSLPPVLEDRTYRDWQACVTNAPQGAVYLHPDAVLVDREAMEQPPFVYVSAGPEAHLQRFSSLAVLVARDLQVPIIPGLPWTVTLRGRRVLDNRLLGENGPQSVDAFVAALVDLIRSGQSECVLFQDLDMNAPLRQAIVRAGERREVTVWCPGDPQPHWWIRFPEPPEQYWSQFSKKTRYNFRYRAKRLEHTLTCVREPQQVPEFLAKAQLLSRHTWQYHRLRQQVTAERGEQHFWEKIASLGAMRSYLLEQNGRPLAYAIGVQWKGFYSFEKTGYDPAYAAYSPGNVLLYRLLEDLIAQDTPSLFDFGFGHSEYKEIFANHCTTSAPLALVGRGLRPSTVMILNRLNRWVGHTSRAILRQVGILRTLKRLYRR